METHSFFWYLGVLVACSVVQTIFTLHILRKMIEGEFGFLMSLFLIGTFGWVIGAEVSRISTEALTAFGQLQYTGLWLLVIVLWGISLIGYYEVTGWLDEKIQILGGGKRTTA